MGNITSKKKNSPNINLYYLTNSLYIINLKIGHVVTIPLNSISDHKISIQQINEQCLLNQKTHDLGIICNKIDKGNAYFVIPEYHTKLIKILNISNSTNILTRKDEQKIYKYKKAVCNRIWLDLSDYCQCLSKLVNQRLNKMLLEKGTNGRQKIKIIADYFKSSDDGRYLYELGNYVISIPLLRNMILDKLGQESKHTRVLFKDIKIKQKIDREMRFTIIVKIKINK